MAVANGGFPFSQRDVVTEIYGDSSNRSLTELYSAAIGTFDPAYVGSKNSLYNFRNYQHIVPNGGYGRLYNGYVIADSRNIAPVGWHVPTPTEVITLSQYINDSGYAGGKLKETGTMHWEYTDAYATNIYDFSAVGGGQRYNHDGSFYGIKRDGYLWSSNYSDTSPCWGMTAYSASLATSSGGYGFGIKSGFPIRLLKNDSINSGTMTDNSGFTYKTIKIGNQVWMASNLRSTHYRNGNDVPVVTDNATWAALTTGACCSYANNDTWSFDNNYVPNDTYVEVSAVSFYNGSDYVMYAESIYAGTSNLVDVNTIVSLSVRYTWYDPNANRTFTSYATLDIDTNQSQSSLLITEGEVTSITLLSVSPTISGTYHYSLAGLN